MSVGSGIVAGGWEFVWSAYGLTIAALLIYGATLVTRMRQAKRNAND